VRIQYLRVVFPVLLILAVLGFSCAQQQPETMASGPSIEGTYRLVSRDLPDGRVQTPPEIMGLTFSGKTPRANLSQFLP
jgi:hypothetical protein